MGLPYIATALVGSLSIVVLYYLLTRNIPSRLHPKQAPKSKFGLVPAIENLPPKDGGVDIVFVHGLGSNPDTTWQTASEAKDGAADGRPFVNWVTDFLPDDIPAGIRENTRLFFFNYESYWKRDSITTRLKTLGGDLIDHISDRIRSSEKDKTRGLIFVGHSYGGLVVKQALVTAKTRLNFDHFVEHTRAVFFLGTPHRGSNFGYWGWLLAQILRPLGSSPILLAQLEYDSTALLDLHKDFSSIIGNDWRIFNFFEQRATRLLRFLTFQWQSFCVSEQSATFERQAVTNIGLPTDHYGLNKFGSKNADYERVCSKLVQALDQSVRPAKHYYVVPVDLVKSYTERPGLQNDIEEKLHIRHENASIAHAVILTGAGGMGKSQLALKYVETHKDRYNPVLWIDATSEETVRSSFLRSARELGLPEGENKDTTFSDAKEVQSVLRLLLKKTDEDEEWLVVVDNVDDDSWGIKTVLPRGKRGSVIITSRDEYSSELIEDGFEKIKVDVMALHEATTLLLRRLKLTADPPPEDVRKRCDEVTERLGCLALAVDLAGAYISNEPDTELALAQYIEDYDRHRDELLKSNNFYKLKPTDKTVWTVWDTTLEKIAKDHPDLQPLLLLTYLAQFNGTIIQDEAFRLTALGLLNDECKDFVDQIPSSLQQFFSTSDKKWDSFSYRQSCELLVRYSLLQKVQGSWPGVTMHKLVQWRAIKGEEEKPWAWWYAICMAAACSQVKAESRRPGFRPEFRRHLITHLPHPTELVKDTRHDNLSSSIMMRLSHLYRVGGRWQDAITLRKQAVGLMKAALGEAHPDTLDSMGDLAYTYYRQGRLHEAELLQVQVVEGQKAVLGEAHPDTLLTMADLAYTYCNQGRLQEAELLQVQVVEAQKAVLGVTHPDTLTTMSNLSQTYKKQGRLQEAELDVQVLTHRKVVLGEAHPHTLVSINNLAFTYYEQGRLQEAEPLQVRVVEAHKTVLGEAHPNTLRTMVNLSRTYCDQGRLREAETMQVLVVEGQKAALGESHYHTLSTMAELAVTYYKQERFKEAEALQAQVLEDRKVVLGEAHTSTLTSMEKLAFSRHRIGRHADALDLMKECLQKRQQVLGLDHGDTQSTLRWVEIWGRETGEKGRFAEDVEDVEDAN